MGIWDRLSRITGVDRDIEELEAGMAGDPAAPAELLRRMAEGSPALRPVIRQNPACPPDLAEWIDGQARPS